MVPEEVRKALLQPDICHRESEFAEILTRVRKELTTVFGGSSEHAMIVLGGSGTASLESVVSSAIRTKTLLVLSNGYYGEKMETLAKIHKVATRTLKLGWGERFNEGDVEQILRSDESISHVAIVHHETSVGILNDLGTFGKLASEYGKTFIVDAVSSVGVEDLNVTRDRIQFCVGTPNKCIESIPGLSFVCADEQELERLSKFPARTAYLDLYSNYLFEEGSGERSGTPFTPPVQAFYALDAALKILLKEGIANRRRRYASLAKKIRNGLEDLGFRFLLPTEHMSNSLTSVIMPKNISYDLLHGKLKKKGFVVYAGQGKLQGKILRIANMGALTGTDIDRFLISLTEVLRELDQKPRYR
jgi:2-aminoethylphosphonate-pyruvate transaminase